MVPDVSPADGSVAMIRPASVAGAAPGEDAASGDSAAAVADTGTASGAGAGAAGAAASAIPPTGRGGRSEVFVVELENFSGPFDLLLSLIAKHKMDVTEVALSKVTDEFVAHLRNLGERFDLGQATEFLVVAATLLDLKAARLLPGAISDDESEDLALLEARDLLFARLLQYKAYKEAAAIFSGLMALESRHTPRAVPLEPRFAAALPEVVIPLTPAELATIAARLREPPLPPQVATDHVHVPRVNVREHMLAVIELLRQLGSADFRVLCAACKQTIEVVARFLALLELYREGRVSFTQETPLGELTVRWVEPPYGQAAGGGGGPPGGDGGDGGLGANDVGHEGDGWDDGWPGDDDGPGRRRRRRKKGGKKDTDGTEG